MSRKPRITIQFHGPKNADIFDESKDKLQDSKLDSLYEMLLSDAKRAGFNNVREYLEALHKS